jgi:hypothetical protein
LLAVTEMKVITRHREMIRNEKLQVWTPANNTAGITILLGAPRITVIFARSPPFREQTIYSCVRI